jgi:hypothetical protein
MNEWNGWQIPHTGVAANSENEHVRNEDGVVTPIRRKSDMRISNFGALWVSPRMAQDVDYTRTVLTFETKDDLSNWKMITTDDGPGRLIGMRGTTVDHNPYLIGSTVKRVRDDQFFRMDMEHPVTSASLLGDASLAPLYPAGDAADIAKPKFDVMDTDLVHSGMDETKNYPSEGWRSFGGKYDFLPYIGTLGKPKGNKRA